MYIYFLICTSALAQIAVDFSKGLTTANDELLLLDKFNQNECITSCYEGLSSCTDRIVLKGSVNWGMLSGNRQPLKVEVRTKDTDTPRHFCTLEKINCKGYTSSDCYCEKGNTSYNIVVNTTAETTFSEAEIVLTLESSHSADIASSPIKLPKIYACNDVRLSINGHEINAQSNVFHIADSKPNIHFCCFNTPTPCGVSIIENNLLLNTSAQCVSHNQETKDATKYTFEYLVCYGHRERILMRSKDECTFYIDREKPAIRVCCENAPSPCVVIIYQMGNKIIQGEHCVTLKGSRVKSFNYSLSFTFCGRTDTIEPCICQELFNSGLCVAVNAVLISLASLVSYIIK